MTTTTKELIDWLNVESKLAKQDDSPIAASRLKDSAQRLRELQAEVDSYCTRPSREGFRIGDHTSAGCIKRGECGCDIHAVKEAV